MLDIKRFTRREVPTIEKLETAPSRRRTFIVLTIIGAFLVASITWWSRHGAIVARAWLLRFAQFSAYWASASQSDKNSWLLIATTVLVGLLVVIKLVHKFVWRAIFPDLYRLDEAHHLGGKSERVGRLYRIRKFLDGDKTRHRHYMKYGNRLLPLFRFDFVDLDEPAVPMLYGANLIRCGRLDRDPKGNRFRRIPSAKRFGSAPLLTTFREAEVAEDVERKTSTVMTGPGTNPEVMRKKWQQQPLVTDWDEAMMNEDLDDAIQEATPRAEAE